MKDVLGEDRFQIIEEADKNFILAFDEAMQKLGYDFGGEIGSGYCWGPYMIIYAKTGVKAKKVAARVFIRKDCIVLRLYFTNIDKHRAYIENAAPNIKEVFTGERGDCSHCEGGHRKDGFCKFRKTYSIDGQDYEKCNGIVFKFWWPDLEKLPDYMGLLKEFYAAKRRASP